MVVFLKRRLENSKILNFVVCLKSREMHKGYNFGPKNMLPIIKGDFNSSSFGRFKEQMLKHDDSVPCTEW